MADERIEVEYIATQQQVLQAFEKLNRRLDTTEKKLEKTGTTSKKAAKLAEGSFAALEKELKDNEAALKRMVIGSKEFEAQRAKVDQLRRSLKGARGELGGVATISQRIGHTAASGVAQVARMAAGMATVSAVVDGVVSELEKASRLKLESARTERTLEQVLADIAPNIGAGNLAEARQFIRQGAVDSGTTQQGFANLIGNAISAGAKDLKEAGQVATAALKLTAGRADTAQALVGGALDITSLSGTNNFTGALGQISQVQSMVRATDAGLFAKNIGGALAAAGAERQNIDALSTEQAFERAAVFSQLTKDQTGAVTGTGLRTYLGRLDKFVPELRKELKDGSQVIVSKELQRQFVAERTVSGRERLFQQNEGLRRQFIDSLEESETKSAVVELVSGTKRAAEILATAEQRITSIDNAESTYNELAAGINAVTPAVRAQRRGEARLEQLQTEGVTGLEGQARQIFEDTVEKVNLPGYDAGRIPIERAKLDSAILAGEDQATATIAALRSATTAKGLFEQDILPQDRAFVESQIQTLQELRDEIQKLRQQREQPIVVQGQNPRPKEAPLPAALLP